MRRSSLIANARKCQFYNESHKGVPPSPLGILIPDLEIVNKKKDIQLLGDVQRHSTKLLKCLKDTEYEDRVQLLNLDSLSCRIVKGDMISVQNG